MVAILGYSRQQIISAVQGMYTAVANDPASPFHFPVGDSACHFLDYPQAQTAQLPAATLDSFAGVGYPFHGEAIQPGDRVLDIGAGAGNDSLIARQLTGPEGHVIALDLTYAMTRKLRTVIDTHDIDSIDVIQASAERLPLANDSIDSITSNGALNLVPNKRLAVAEMFRVLRPRGRLQIADIVIQRPVSVDCHDDPRLWVECVVGATVKEDLLALFRDAGFEDIQELNARDYFALSPSEQTRDIASSFGAHTIELSMRRGLTAPSLLQQWLRRLDPRRWFRSIWRRGLLGVISLILALLSCYGTLATVAILPLLGLGLTIDEGIWATSIVIFSFLTLLAITAGIRRHHTVWPLLVGIGGTVILLYTLFVDYQPLIELGGFILLIIATGWDLYQRRKREADVLGLSSPSHAHD
ncbi:MerC family mercury resistance protein [Aidingimonas lacisalsi]|uniref:MerC family mercury resistance protein n=1 Tax=Aidingimonas lacisalsi TaxID=2604086 RepID=UPI0011D19FB2|nr:MerC family mercury resistance protein [Aidingimonas lacisalsi]